MCVYVCDTQRQTDTDRHTLTHADTDTDTDTQRRRHTQAIAMDQFTVVALIALANTPSPKGICCSPE